MAKTDQGHFICDIDGVLLDIVSTACDVLNEDFPGNHLTPADICTWDWEYALSFQPSYWTPFWQKVWSRPSKPYPGANEFLGMLRGLGFTPVGLSTRPEKWKGLVPADIARQRAEVDNVELDLEYIIYVDNHNDKNQKARDLWPDARFSIEDSPKNARDLGDIEHIHQSFLIDRPWNRGSISIDHKWARVYSYLDVVGQLMSGGLLK